MSSIQREDTANQRDLFDDDVGKMTETSGASQNVTPETLSVSRDEPETTDDEPESLDRNPPMGQPSDVDRSDNSSVESPFDLKLNFNSNFIMSFKIGSPALGSSFFSPSSMNASTNQSSGSSDSKDHETTINTDDRSDEVETETSVSGRIPYHYLDDDDVSSTPSGYWDVIETAGLKRKAEALVSTPKKSPDEILDDAMLSSAEHHRQVMRMKSCLRLSTPLANKKLRCHLLNEVHKYATSSGSGGSTTEDQESLDEDDRKETPEERCQRLRDDDDDE